MPFRDSEQRAFLQNKFANKAKQFYLSRRKSGISTIIEMLLIDKRNVAFRREPGLIFDI
jgi:hypothetical protein